MLPVKGRWVPLGLTAEHHLSAILARLKGKHHTARLFGEHRPQQDSASWVENQQNYISFDVLVSPKTHFHFFLRANRFQRLTLEESKWKTELLKKRLNHNKSLVWVRPCEQSPWAFFILVVKSCQIPEVLHNQAGNLHKTLMQISESTDLSKAHCTAAVLQHNFI